MYVYVLSRSFSSVDNKLIITQSLVMTVFDYVRTWDQRANQGIVNGERLNCIKYHMYKYIIFNISI